MRCIPPLCPLILGAPLLAIGLTGDAHAGAWPRAKGGTFASASVRLSWPQDVTTWTSTAPTDDYRTLYIEHGLTDRITLGLDFGHGVSGARKGVVFVQLPLRNRDNGPKVSAQLGLGRIRDETVLRPGLSVGWGLPNGWLSFDSVAEWHVDSQSSDVKLDATWGHNLPGGRKLILQVQTGQEEDDPYFIRLAPSLVTPLGKYLKLEGGGTWGLTGDMSMGVMFGLWAEF